MAYGQGYGRDNDAAVETSKTIPQATLRSIAGMDDHNILYEMYCRGDLDTFLTDVFGEADTG